MALAFQFGGADTYPGGAIAGASGYAAAFVVPLACYALLMLFALAAGRAEPRVAVQGTPALGH